MGHTEPSKQDGRVLGTPDDHYLFVAPSKTRLMMIGLLMLSLVALGYGIYVLSTVGGRPAMVLCVGAAVVTVAVWGGLQARIPQRIEVDRAVITIVRNGNATATTSRTRASSCACATARSPSRTT